MFLKAPFVLSLLVVALSFVSSYAAATGPACKGLFIAEPQVVVRSLLEQIETFHDRKDYVKGLKLVDSFLQTSPRNVEALNYRIDFLIGLNRINEARNTRSQINKIDPTEKEYQLNYMIYLLSLDQYTEVLEMAERGIILSPGVVTNYEMKHAALLKLKRRAEADDMNAEFAFLFPNSVMGLYARALALQENNDLLGALDLAKKILKTKPKDRDALIMQVRLLSLLNRPEEAAIANAKIIAANPQDIKGITMQAGFLHRSGELQATVVELNKAIALEPNNDTLYSFKASTLAQLGRYEDALGAVNKALELNPNVERSKAIKTNILLELEHRRQSGSSAI